MRTIAQILRYVGLIFCIVALLGVTFLWRHARGGTDAVFKRTTTYLPGSALQKDRQVRSDADGVEFSISNKLFKQWADEFSGPSDNAKGTWHHDPEPENRREGMQFVINNDDNDNLQEQIVRIRLPFLILGLLCTAAPGMFIARKMRSSVRPDKRAGQNRVEGGVVAPENKRRISAGLAAYVARAATRVLAILCCFMLILWWRSKTFEDKFELTHYLDRAQSIDDRYVLLQSDGYGLKFWFDHGKVLTPEAMEQRSRNRVFDSPNFLVHVPDKQWLDESSKERFVFTHDFVAPAGMSEFAVSAIIPHWAGVAMTGIFPLTALGLCGWRLLRAKRRVAQGRCPACGYDLRGGSNLCPECGRSSWTTIPTDPPKATARRATIS